MKITLKDIKDLIDAGNALAENLSEHYSADEVPDEIKHWDNIISDMFRKFELGEETW